MEKYKFLVFDAKTTESTEVESSVNNELVKKLQEVFKSINDNNITVSPISINPNDLSVGWGIIETIDGQQRLTHHLTLKNKKYN